MNDPVFDPDALTVHRAFLQAGLPPFESLSPCAARALLADLRKAANVAVPEIAQVADLSVNGLGLRLYRPAHGVLPVVVFLHGGGWVLGNLDSHDNLCRKLALASGCAVLAVDYRLAPEYPFPAALDDAVDALRWLTCEGKAHDLDATRTAVMGDSAGGNLAAVLAIMARDGTVPPVSLQVLLYPVTDVSLTQPSHRMQIEGLAVNGSTMRWFRDHYIADAAADWRAAPLQAPSLRSIAPCLILTAGIDPLRDEGLAYAARLAAEEVSLEHRHYPGQIHGFLTAGMALPTAQRELTLIGQRLAHTLR